MIAAWTRASEIGPGLWRFNPLLDLPLKPYAGMDKIKLWEMFVYRLAESEVENLLQFEQSWARSPEPSSIDSATLPSFVNEERGWKENQEAPLRTSDLAAAVIVWLWRNGLHHEATGVLERIWRVMRERQRRSSPKCIPWPAESALEGFRVAAYRDWDDDDQAKFAALFRERHVDKEIEQGIKRLTK